MMKIVCPEVYRAQLDAVLGCLSDDLRRTGMGHCYVASEALYHLLGGKPAGFKPRWVYHEGGTHWYLVDRGGWIIDATGDQFGTKVPYHEGRGCGFLTRRPSKRAKIVLERVGARIDSSL